MHDRARRPWTPRWVASCGALIAVCLAFGSPSAQAAGPPLIGATWSSAVGSDSAKLSAEIDPNGNSTTYHFDYTTEAAYQADKAILGHDGFTGALRSPASGEYSLGLTPLTVTKQLFGLATGTTYRYRVVAGNSGGSTSGSSPPHTFTTESAGPLLLDSRGWEMVSPVQKNGGQADPPGAIAAGGVLQAASQGGSVTYSSTASFSGGGGSPPASQYLAARNSSGWSTQNITAPIFSGSYDLYDQGVPYQLFSSDLASTLLLNGDHCRSGASGCAVANPPLAGSDAPAGYQDYYRRDNGNGAFSALLTSSAAAVLDIAPAYFDLRLAGASPDLAHVVLSTCAALTPGATEVPAGSGCDPAEQNLYEWTSGSALTLINGAVTGAALSAPSGAVSTNGDRVYFTRGGNLYLREVGAAQTNRRTRTRGRGDLRDRLHRRLDRLLQQGRAPLALQPGLRQRHRPHSLRRGGGSARGRRQRLPPLLPDRRGPLPVRERQRRRQLRSLGDQGRRRRRLRRLPARHRHRPGQRRRHQAALPLLAAAHRLRQHRPGHRQPRLRGLPLRLERPHPHLPLLQPHQRAPQRPLDDPRLDRQRHRPRLHRRLQATRPLQPTASASSSTRATPWR